MGFNRNISFFSSMVLKTVYLLLYHGLRLVKSTEGGWRTKKMGAKNMEQHLGIEIRVTCDLKKPSFIFEPKIRVVSQLVNRLILVGN